MAGERGPYPLPGDRVQAQTPAPAWGNGDARLGGRRTHRHFHFVGQGLDDVRRAGTWASHRTGRTTSSSRCLASGGMLRNRRLHSNSKSSTLTGRGTPRFGTG